MRRKCTNAIPTSSVQLSRMPDHFSVELSSVDSSEPKPNIIIMLMDDVGWGDLGAFGNPAMETPNLDKMAKEGALLTDFYSASPVCSPTRASLLTGRLPIRNGIYSDIEHAENAYVSVRHLGGIPDSEILLPEILREAGYTSMLVGKWHLGHEEAHLPLNHGFDHFFGSPGCHFGPFDSGNFPVYRDSEMIGRYFEEFVIDENTGLSNMTRLFIEEGLSFIKEQATKDDPFFLYWSPDATHTPLYASHAFRGKSQRGLYGDAIMELDSGVGLILELLRELQIDQNTFVFFTSDNGAAIYAGEEGGSNGQFLCGKGITFEGGMREPSIAWWPSHIQPGIVSHQVGSSMDLFTTSVILAGLSVPEDRIIDGSSLLPSLLEQEVDPERTVFYYRGNEMMAIRRGMYKAHYWTWVGPLKTGDPSSTQPSNCFGQGVPGVTSEELTDHTDCPLLFHLGKDPGEKYPIPNDSHEYMDAMLTIRAVETNHKRDMVPGEPQLNICGVAEDISSPPGCEKINKCVPVPEGTDLEPHDCSEDPYLYILV